MTCECTQRAAYDVAISAQGGLMHITGPDGGDPVHRKFKAVQHNILRSASLAWQ